MIILKSEKELDLMRTAGKVTGQILADLEDFIRPGITTKDIDAFIEKRIKAEKMTPSFLGLYDFPASACVSINQEIIHGIPRNDLVLKEGDIVSVDTGATYKGYVSDAARTYAVGEISEEAKRLIQVTEESFFEGLKYCKPGNRISDIGHAIQKHVEAEGFSVVRDFVGHGVGRDMHEDPQVPNYGLPGRGPRIAKGMVLAIEPMINQGTYKTESMNVSGQIDNWTFVTKDGKLSCHYENTVAITDGEPEIFTLV